MLRTLPNLNPRYASLSFSLYSASAAGVYNNVTSRRNSGLVQAAISRCYMRLVQINNESQIALAPVFILRRINALPVSKKASSQLDCQRNQADLNNIHLWPTTSLLPLSVPKCQCLHLGKNNVNYSYTIGGVPISVVSECVDLGLKRTSDFRYDVHIPSFMAKASRSVGSFSERYQREMNFPWKAFCGIYPAHARVCLRHLEPI